MPGWIILLLFLVLVIGLLPSWPYSTSWGYYPSGGTFLILVILAFLLLRGR